MRNRSWRKSENLDFVPPIWRDFWKIEIISWNQLKPKVCACMLLSRNFCEKSVRENFCIFHIVPHLRKKNSWKQRSRWKVTFTKYFRCWWIDSFFYTLCKTCEWWIITSPILDWLIQNFFREWSVQVHVFSFELHPSHGSRKKCPMGVFFGENVSCTLLSEYMKPKNMR